jgi:hypothetical protein
VSEDTHDVERETKRHLPSFVLHTVWLVTHSTFDIGAPYIGARRPEHKDVRNIDIDEQ